MEDYEDYLYKIAGAFDMYFFFEEKDDEDIYKLLFNEGIPDFDKFCRTYQDNKRPPIIIERLYKLCNEFIVHNRQRMNEILDSELNNRCKIRNVRLIYIYNCCEGKINIMNRYFSIDIKEYPERSINTKVPKQKEQPNLIDLITIPEGSTTTKEDIINVVRELKDEGNIGLIILYMEDKGYISTTNRKRNRVLRAVMAETNRISISPAGLGHYFNSQYKDSLLKDAKKLFTF